MIQYPLRFQVSSTSDPGVAQSWTTHYLPAQGPAQMATVAVPPEFEGPGGGYSPEDFYALALLNCFIATFKVIAEKSKLHYHKIGAQGALTVDRDEKGVPWMSAFELKVTITGAVDADRTKRLLEKTSQSCMILNSVKTVKTFEWNIETAAV